MPSIGVVVIHIIAVHLADLFYDGQSEPDAVVALVTFLKPLEQFTRRDLRRYAGVADA